jgi:thiol:disulfide interchange protein DsbD
MARWFFFLSLFWCFLPLGQAKSPLGERLFQDELLPAEEAFRFTAEVVGQNRLRLSWQIADGYYLYRDRFQVEKLAGLAELGPLQLPPGERKDDPEFGPTEVYHRNVTALLPLAQVSPEGTELKLKVRYQGCAERGVCYPPQVKTVSLTLPPTAGKTSSLPSEPDRIAKALKDQSFWLTLLSFTGFGLLLAFTPCCFPMLPILSGIIVGHGQNLTSWRAFGLSLSYVLASASTYAAFGLLAGLFGANLQAAFQKPWVIVAFSLLFVLLALSMFGVYELQIPAAWQSRLASRRIRGGSFLNAAALGILSALIVGPCVAPPLAGALLYLSQTGDILLSGAALFALGLGMGLPLIAVGTSAGKLLPKAGLWMNTVKAVFGVLLLGVAIWLLARILPPSVILFLWAVWLIIPAIYLGATSPLPENAPHRKKLGKALGIVMLTYGILLLIGVAAGSQNPFKPLEPLALRTPSTQAAQIAFRQIDSPEALEAALEQTRGTWTMVDVYADWCISCKELEAYTFTDPEVRKHLAKFSLLRVDITENLKPHQELMQRFGLIGPPALLFFDPEGRECKAARLIGYVPPGEFAVQLAKLELNC